MIGVKQSDELDSEGDADTASDLKKIDIALRMLEERGGPIRLQRFTDAGISACVVRHLVRQGKALNPMVGIYFPLDEYDDLYVALSGLSARGSEYLLCLKSAAEYHGLADPEHNLLWVGVSISRNVPPKAGVYSPFEIHWQDVQLPQKPSPAAIAAFKGDGLTDMEATERYLGIETQYIYGEAVKLTSAARTVVDLLLHMNRPIRRGNHVQAISPEYAFNALRKFAEKNDLWEVRKIADRLGGRDQIEFHLSLERVVN